VNLLGNAVKFTQHGEVTLRVKSEDGDQYSFEVQDTGPGIASEYHETIFEPFQQDGRTAALGGTGLGLAIARRGVELIGWPPAHGLGPGQGARFYFTLELPPVEEEPRRRESEDWHDVERLAAGTMVTALVVDDIDTNRDILRQLLQRIGVEVRTADGGEQALRMVGGMMMTSRKQIDALREIGVSEVVVDTSRCDVVPDEAFADDESDDSADGSDDSADESDDIFADDESDDSAEVPEVDGLPEFMKLVRPKGARSNMQRRRNFGPKKTGWMKLEVAESGDRATLQVLSFGGDKSLGEDDVRRCLEEDYGIRTGIESAVLTRLVQQAAASPNRVISGAFPIAEGPAGRPAAGRDRPHQ
jgi:hypothetical protein